MKRIHFDEIDSTSLYLKNNHALLEDMTFVDANYQTAGKGREDRKWISNRNEDLLCSLLIKNKSLIEKYQSISILSACIVYEFLSNLGLKDIFIKWPNDVFIKDKKICGILLEGQIYDYLAIGVGLNVNSLNHCGIYRIEPTSIKKELNKEFDLEVLKEEFFQTFDKYLKMYEKGLYEPLTIVRAHNYLKGKQVTYNNKTGKVLDINDDYSLLIENDSGIESISSGEVMELK
ncbi:MAG: biotin--[acetyl-CoA-carboxylase] ligase [Bacilli bacterium]|nr:biotin--[acetyl-CoA-carboxylase] ligase [Bacilli bacterium]